LFSLAWVAGMIVMPVGAFTDSRSTIYIGAAISFLSWGGCCVISFLPRQGSCVPKWCEQNAYGINVSV
jgi:hypothetical protein